MRDWVKLPSGMFIDLSKVSRFIYLGPLTTARIYFSNGDVQFVLPSDAEVINEIMEAKATETAGE